MLLNEPLDAGTSFSAMKVAADSIAGSSSVPMSSLTLPMTTPTRCQGSAAAFAAPPNSVASSSRMICWAPIVSPASTSASIWSLLALQ